MKTSAISACARRLWQKSFYPIIAGRKTQKGDSRWFWVPSAGSSRFFFEPQRSLSARPSSFLSGKARYCRQII